MLGSTFNLNSLILHLQKSLYINLLSKQCEKSQITNRLKWEIDSFCSKQPPFRTLTLIPSFSDENNYLEVTCFRRYLVSYVNYVKLSPLI